MKALITKLFLYDYKFRTNLPMHLASILFFFLPLLLIGLGDIGFIFVAINILLAVLGLIQGDRKNFTYTMARAHFVADMFLLLGATLMINNTNAVYICILSIICAVLSISMPQIYRYSYNDQIDWHDLDNVQKWEHGKSPKRLPKEHIKEWDKLDRYFTRYFK